MSIDLLKNIVDELPRGKALLGLDIGKTTIGVAVCDPAYTVATPLETIRRTKFTKDIARLEQLVREYDVGGFVLGFPVHMDGSEGRKCQSVRDFALELVRYPDIVGEKPWVALWDERLSTATVEDFVDETVAKRKTRAQSKDSGLIDKLAAQHILQGAIDFI